MLITFLIFYLIFIRKRFVLIYKLINFANDLDHALNDSPNALFSEQK